MKNAGSQFISLFLEKHIEKAAEDSKATPGRVSNLNSNKGKNTDNIKVNNIYTNFSCKSSDDNNVTERVVELQVISRNLTRAHLMEKFNPLYETIDWAQEWVEAGARNSVDNGKNTRGLTGFIFESKVSFAICDPPFEL